VHNRKNTSAKYPSASKRFAIGAASVLTAGALVGVGAQGAFAASPDADPSGSASASATATATATATASPHGMGASGTGSLSLNAVQNVVGDAFSGRINGAKAQAFAKKIAGNAALFSLLPANLQSDLTALKGASVADRAADAQKLVSTALAGGYGPTIQGIAEQLHADHGKSLTSIARKVLGDLKSGDIGARGAAIASTVTGDAKLFASLPSALQTDLAQLAGAPVSERTADVQKIATTALSGGYGGSIQKIAEQIQTGVLSAG
jgi:hypothetical protein